MKKLILPLILVIGGGLFAGWYFYLDGKDDKPETENTVVSDSAKGGSDSDDVPFGDPPTEEELNREKLLREHARPSEFIMITFGNRKNILGETVVEGTMTNNAELTTFRDLQLMLYFEDGSGQPIDSASQTVFERMPPGGKAEFKLKEKGPRKAKEVRVMVKDAVVEQAE